MNVFYDHCKNKDFKWDLEGQGHVFTDNYLCFSSMALNIFSTISGFIIQVARLNGVAKIVNYLDDYLIVANSYEEGVNQ